MPSKYIDINSLQKRRFIMVTSLFVGLLMSVFVLAGNKLMASDSTSFAEGRQFESGIRDFSIIATDEGFYPQNLTAFSGEKVRFFITSTTSLPSCFIVEGKELFVEAKNGHITEAETYFNSPGVYRFYCPKGQISGNLTVLEHPRIIRERERRREMASEEKEKKSEEVKIWLPRDE